MGQNINYDMEEANSSHRLYGVGIKPTKLSDATKGTK
jgi:hypothetical protein